MTKALVLLSGGLDSSLAMRVLLEQGIELEAINFITVFCNCTPHGHSCHAAAGAVRGLGIKLKVMNISEEYLDIVKAPKFGYGKNLNPCIDCRIFMFRKAAQYMKDIGASFLVTGEVLGERPMSQRLQAMKIIEKEAQVEGLVLRPLSAQILEPTIPELNGWVDRDRFYSITGRSRKIQISLAEDYGITDYPCPAGGCLLTDAGFASRMKDLLKYKPDFQLLDVKFLKIGRHFRINPNLKAVIGRDEDENRHLTDLKEIQDAVLEPLDIPGPVAILRGRITQEDISLAASIAAAYVKADKTQALKITCQTNGQSEILEVIPYSRDRFKAMQIGVLEV